jgi:hypothetical protein
MMKFLHSGPLGMAAALVLMVHAPSSHAQTPVAQQPPASARAAVVPQAGVTPSGPRRQPRTAQPRRPAQANFDGLWSVLIVTDNGPCDRSFRYPIRITRGIVQHAQATAGSLFSIGGQVGRNGGVHVVVSRDGHRADGTGRLAATSGGGSWQAAGGICSGRWMASRRG